MFLDEKGQSIRYWKLLLAHVFRRMEVPRAAAATREVIVFGRTEPC